MGSETGEEVGVQNIDLNSDSSQLKVDISDALSEKDKVKFTVHTRSSMPEFHKNEFSVMRLHEDFIWLHDDIRDNMLYAGYIVPPAPPRPDFDASREKLQKLGEAESGQLTKEEFNKMKQELEAEYLATFKKTVAQHEVFLSRLASHPVFKSDRNLHVFLEYDQDLNVRGKNKKERLVDIFSSFQKTGDEFLLSNTVKDIDDFFESEKTFLITYNQQLKDACIRSDKMSSTHKELADNYIKLSSGLLDLATLENSSLEGFLSKLSETFEKMRRIEGRVANDQDLKLSDFLRFHMRDTSAAKDLLFRRLKSLNNYEKANKELDAARSKNRDVGIAENRQQEACTTFETMSQKAKEELKLQRERRVLHFQKSLSELAELEVKHARAHAQMLRQTIASIRQGL
ncbi:sorting nexin-6 [Eurytemora carolleeae]|uniref:sorting nexin-6 n=1 Tax=Eurytemora carolleeae TaxID=1294199 RepID=UPI000C767BC5|nr:sorting nexin-6 [Eurytemora carolleeae]|eukprot:XP_023326179.1 sorting nexin-6-like [Eurytemora affinis]